MKIKNARKQFGLFFPICQCDWRAEHLHEKLDVWERAFLSICHNFPALIIPKNRLNPEPITSFYISFDISKAWGVTQGPDTLRILPFGNYESYNKEMDFIEENIVNYIDDQFERLFNLFALLEPFILT